MKVMSRRAPHLASTLSNVSPKSFKKRDQGVTQVDLCVIQNGELS